VSATTRDHVRNVAADNGYERDGELSAGSPWDAFVRSERRVAIKFSRANDRVLKVTVNGSDVRGRYGGAITALAGPDGDLRRA
jgi:lactam utilization protein B